MPEENNVDFASLCEELSARVESLEAQLAEEQDKNAVLVQQVVEAEDTIANREVESFAEVIDPEDKDYWRERMIENRETTLAVLNRMKAKRCTPEGKECTPAKGKPLHNRTGAPDPAPRQSEDTALKLRNRAQEIVKRDGCGYMIAFRRAESELSTPKGE
jgi:cell division septum initiation protein DivIVA